jgi:hypothetical protein
MTASTRNTGCSRSAATVQDSLDGTRRAADAAKPEHEPVPEDHARATEQEDQFADGACVELLGRGISGAHVQHNRDRHGQCDARAGDMLRLLCANRATQLHLGASVGRNALEHRTQAALAHRLRQQQRGDATVPDAAAKSHLGGSERVAAVPLVLEVPRQAPKRRLHGRRRGALETEQHLLDRERAQFFLGTLERDHQRFVARFGQSVAPPQDPRRGCHGAGCGREQARHDPAERLKDDGQ